MFTIYADDNLIKAVVKEQISLFYARRRGPRRKIEKILGILLPVSWFSRGKSGRSLTKDEIKKLLIININENTLEDYLQFLSRFPKDKPFLLKGKEHRTESVQTETGIEIKNIGGAPKDTYKFNSAWLAHTGQGPYQIGAYLA